MIAHPHWSADHLPPWFVRPSPIERSQLTFFPEELSVVLVTLSVSEDELARWYGCGWVSFGPDRHTLLEQWDVNEIRFVRDVVRSGLSDAFVARLLEALPRPLNFSPDEVSYSFGLGWVMVAPAPEPNSDEIVEEWIESLAEDEAEDRLTQLRDRIDGLLGVLGRPKGK